jgi:hypothetical protein
MLHQATIQSNPHLLCSLRHFSAVGRSLMVSADDHFGHARRRTLSQRDVPGVTRAVVPLLARRGVQALSIGENQQCAPVNVPPIFLWKDLQTNTELIAMYHPFGYGRRRRLMPAEQKHLEALANGDAVCGRDANGTLTGTSAACAADDNVLFYVDANGDTVMKAAADPYDDGPSIHVDPATGAIARPAGEVPLEGPRAPTGLAVPHEGHCVEMAAAGAALCFAWRIDNSGPHDTVEAGLIYDEVSSRYPNATVVASSAFDDFVDEVVPVKDQLPVVTSEVGTIAQCPFRRPGSA